MVRSPRRQDWRLFVVLSVFGGLFFIIMGVMLLSENITVAICFILLGLTMMCGMVVIFKIFFNANAGKKDESIAISYQMQSDTGVEILDNMEHLKEKLEVLEPGQEICITLIPEYFGLVSWRFFKKKSRYVSFVTIHKKEKTTQFFITPMRLNA